MYQGVLAQIREKVRLRQYIMTLHAEEEMSDDDLSVFDIESCILTGEIIERQKDRETGEYKYLIEGDSAARVRIVVVVKISLTGKLVFITTYRV